MTKTNWKNKLKTVLGKDEFLEVSTNSALAKADKTRIKLVSSVNVSVNSVDTFQKSTGSPEYNEESNLVSSAFVSGQLVDTPKNNDELLDFKAGKFREVLNRFIENGVTFDVSIDDFQIIDNAGILKTSDKQFFELNYSIIICQLQQRLLMKHLFNHSPERFEDFAFEIAERELLLTKADEKDFEIYFQIVKSVTRKWFAVLLGEVLDPASTFIN